MNKTNGKIRLYAEIAEVSTELDAVNKALGIPPKEDRQPDLQYISSIFVSTGMNLNGAYFLPSELYAAINSIKDKPLDIGHNEEQVVGHLFSRTFLTKDKGVMETAAFEAEDLDTLSFDVATGMYVYKARFPEVAQDVSDGKYKVSMECFYRGFDVILGDVIIPYEDAEKAGLITKINKMVRVVEDGVVKGTFRVGRVLRGILFSGCGLVENPANPESVILEAASKEESDFEVDLTKVDNYSTLNGMAKATAKKAAKIRAIPEDKEKSNFSIFEGGAHRHTGIIGSGSTLSDGQHRHVVLGSDLPHGTLISFAPDGEHRHAFDISKGTYSNESEHTHVVSVMIEDSVSGAVSRYLVETGPPLKGHSHSVETVVAKTPVTSDDMYFEEVPNESNIIYSDFSGDHAHVFMLNDGTKIKTLTMKDMLPKVAEEDASVARTDTDVCVSYRRFIYGPVPTDTSNVTKDMNTPGMIEQEDSLPIPEGGNGGDSDISPRAELIHEHWCTLFDTGCTVSDGVASHPDCLRNILNRATKDVVNSYTEKLNKNREIPAIKKLQELIDKASTIIKDK